jgi:hypothetical protein
MGDRAETEDRSGGGCIMQPTLGLRLLRIAGFYLVISLLIGMYMAMTNDRTLVSVHSHVALLGWTTMGLIGLVYLVVPRWTIGWPSRIHFWLHNLGMPIMLSSLALHDYGNAQVEPLIGLGSVLVLLSLVAFSLGLFRTMPEK